MMLICSKCGHKQPMTEEDIAFFHPRFFCLACGDKLSFETTEAALAGLRKSNDRSRTLAAPDLQGLPPADQLRKIAKREGASADGGG